MNQCLYCNNPTNNKFCNNSCSAKYNNSRRKPRTEESRQKTSSAMLGKKHPDSVKKKISSSLQGRKITWIIKHTEDGLQKIREAAQNRIVSEDTREKLRQAAHRRGLGGHTSKKRMDFVKSDGTVVHLQSSYEVRFATLLEEFGIEWSRPAPLMWKDDKGVEHRYYPDFLVGSTYFDTKNDYLIKVDAAKIEAVRIQNNVEILVVSNSMITEDYVGSLV